MQRTGQTQMEGWVDRWEDGWVDRQVSGWLRTSVMNEGRVRRAQRCSLTFPKSHSSSAGLGNPRQSDLRFHSLNHCLTFDEATCPSHQLGTD